MADSRNGARNIGDELRNSLDITQQGSSQRLVGSYRKKLGHNWRRLS